MGFARRLLVPLSLLVLLACSPGSSEAAATDTVSVGFLATSPDPNKVHVGGVWDFDTPAYAPDISGTDSTQFWTFLHIPNFVDLFAFPTPADRYWWFYDWGNNINAGDHNLWMGRVGSRVFRRTGLAGVWHQDDLSTVPDTSVVSPGFASNISGSGSAWCGLRLSGDANAPVDPYTGNSYTSDVQFNDIAGGEAVRSAYPGYAGQWDQLLYRDFPYDSQAPGTVAFDYRAELNSAPTADVSEGGGAGWYTPDPFSLANLITGTGAAEPVDSFEVWAGAPREAGVYDSAHRYLSDTIDFALGGTDAPKLIFALTGVVSGSASPAIPGGASWATVRVVLRVKTNRAFDDRRPSTNGTGWNSTTGAVVLDNMNINGTLSDFESSGQILPRFTWVPLGGANASVTENSPSDSWITTGREPRRYGHVDNLSSLPFAPINGPCGVSGNVALQSDHDDPNHSFNGESQNWMISPTICLTGPRAAQQGIPSTLRSEAAYLKVTYDYYNGNDDVLETGRFYKNAVRSMGSEAQKVGPQLKAWSPFASPGLDASGYTDSTCFRFDMGTHLQPFINLPATDSLQVGILDQVRCARFGATACGKVRGGYMDNILVEFVRDQPFTGIEPGAPTLDFVRGAYPNPSRDGSATVLFSMRRAVPVSILFYDLRGSLVHEARIDAHPGENRYRWDGVSDRGPAVGSGVYFYRLFADGVEFRNNEQRIVFVGRREN